VSKRALQFYSFLSVIAIYVVFTSLTTPSRAILVHYHLSLAGYRLIIATVAVPLIIIWLTAYYGFRKLSNYADTIKDNKDGTFVSQISMGLTVLVFQLPLTSAVGSVLSLIAAHHPRFVPTSTILQHYIKIILPLVAFLWISYGSRGLSEIVKRRPTQRATYILALIFIIIGTAFTFFVFHGVPATAIVNSTNQAEFFLPTWLIFFTIVIPNIFTWYIGLLAAYEIYLFRSKVTGIIYRRAWEYLAGGLAEIIAVSIFYEYLTLLSSHLTRLKVNALLLVVYAALILLAVGYALVAVGAHKLQKIEEV
jgi:hypothetical protein